MSSIRIFICHPDTVCLTPLRHEVFTPLLYGAALQPVPEGCLSDRSGSSWSLQAWKYGALAAHYWIFKNYLPQAQEDYIGLFTHDRMLDFSAPGRTPDGGGNSRLSTSFYWQYICRLRMPAWTAPLILSRLDGCDVALPRLRSRDNCTVRTGFAFLRNGQELERTLQIMQRHCPDYLPHAERFLDGRTEYMHGCFIMKRPLLAAYMNWLFELMAVLEPGSRWHEYTSKAERYMPFSLMCTLLNVWLAHRMASRPLRLIELQNILLMTEGDNTSDAQMLDPILRLGNARCGPQTYRVFAEVFCSMDPDLKTRLCLRHLQQHPEQCGLLLDLMHTEPGQPTLRKVRLLLQASS